MEAAVRAVSSPRRREILRLVWSRELSSGEIASHFDVSWPAISQNLAVLRRAGLVVERRDGNRRLYRVDPDTAGSLEALLQAMWEVDLDEIKHLAEADAADERSAP